MTHEKSTNNIGDDYDDLDLDETLCEYCYLGRAGCICTEEPPKEDPDYGDEA